MADSPLNHELFGLAERRRSRTYQPWGYHGLPVLKTGWATGPVPLQGRIHAEFLSAQRPLDDKRESRVSHAAIVPTARRGRAKAEGRHRTP